MSNIFNSPNNRTKILSALKTGGAKVVEDYLLPPRFRPEKDPIDNPSAAAKLLKSRGYRMLRARAIPDMVGVETEEVLPHLVTLTKSEGGLLSDELHLPEGNNGFYPKYYPFHKPNHEEVGEFGAPDLALLKQVAFYLLETEYSNGPSLLHDIRQAMETLQYGSGSYSGQLERLIAMKEVATGRNPNKPPKTCGYTSEQIAKILEETLPVNRVPDDWPELKYRPSSLLDPDQDQDYLPPITQKSSSGLPYVGKTKGETLGEGLAIADTFVAAIGEAARSANPEKATQDVLAEFWYLSCGLLFPKAERYKQKDWDKKTRNIWSAPFPTHLILSMISWPVLNNSKINALTHPTPSLYGFSPFHGGMDTIMGQISAAIDGGTELVYIYADNIYIMMEDTWFSIDLEKGEANCTPEHMQAMCYYLLTRGWTQENGRPLYNATWAQLAMSVLPCLVVDSSCILMNIQMKTYGQGSGNAFTFLNNHVLSSLVVHQWLKAGKPRPGTPEFTALEGKTGVNFKVEREIPNLKAEMLKCIDTAPTTGLLADGSDQPNEQPGYQLGLDLLGWSAVYSRQLGAFVPVLDYERLVASAAYPRGLENKTLKRRPGAELAYRLVRYEALRLVGGWANPLLEKALSSMTDAMRSSISRKGLHVETWLQDWTETSEFGEGLDDIDLNVKLTNESLVKVNTPKEEPTERTPSKSKPTEALSILTQELAQGLYKDPKSQSMKMLDTRTQAKLADMRLLAEKLKTATPADSDDWAEATEAEFEYNEALRKANTSAKTALTQVREALEEVSKAAPPRPGKTAPEKSTEGAANPTVHYHEYSKNPPLSKTAKKNMKRRKAAKEAKH
uniref:RNA-directed RNA polymerase n=1 Tax=Rocky Mountain birnavirus TaxID=3077841 RepID=A0AA96HJ47_9VIRU|nr:VP1 [Rocky Mountain birnavirus]